ncbi:MAG: (2Fe-2S)-binding protein [Eubacteriales bacterium]|nr:(2Fe-2S)-binding protein [Eubacteriales bacterium]
MKKISFELNGKNVEIEVEPGELLLDLLRERFRLTGTKRGCEVGECGACTILLDGEPTTSCLLLAELVDGRSVTTIEALSNGTELHPIQEAFIEEGAVQCGFCTPGMILSTLALLRKNPYPSREEIKVGLAGNFCRCGAHEHIIRAVQKAGRIMAETGNKVH